MLRWSYALCLLLSIGGLLAIDWREQFAFWREPRHTALTLLSALGVFVIWDIFGIHLHIFLNGDSPYTLGLELFPEFPVEELLFLFLICYTTLILYQGAVRGYRHVLRPGP